jgi:hypothetical protein
MKLDLISIVSQEEKLAIEDELFYDQLLGTKPIVPPVIQPLEKRFEQYDLAQEKLREFFDIQSFCLDKCINSPYSLYGLRMFEKPKEKDMQDSKFGCCFKDEYRTNFPQDVKARFLKLQEENQNLSHPKTKGGCSYHTTNGCSLTKYKSPVCIAYACPSLRYTLSFHQNIKYNSGQMVQFFDHIFKGKITNQLFEEFIDNVTKATDRIKEIKAGNNPNIDQTIVFEY